MDRKKMIINNLRHRGATKYDIEAEINFRKENVTPKDEKCFGYTTEELEIALNHWDSYFYVKVTLAEW